MVDRNRFSDSKVSDWISDFSVIKYAGSSNTSKLNFPATDLEDELLFLSSSAAGFASS